MAIKRSKSNSSLTAKQMMYDLDEEQEEEGFGWTLIKWTYLIFKVIVIVGLIAGIIISQQFHNLMNSQVKEICELIRICD